ncbi:kinase-like domain-containing protein [Baffinella frigidus]|nr:kinase-like domain-containing protein [Cryptophyta sp. CCMP2293]
MKDKEFHTNFCRCQGQAQALADNFNRRVRGGPNLQINFLSCCVYTVKDDRWPGGEAQFLAEPFLEGEFIKFNNNGGAVNKWGAARPVSALQRPPAALAGPRFDLDEIGEEDEEEEAGSAAAQRAAMGADDIPQCFSHFTHFFTSGDKLVCDLQGIYNDVDGFVLTDPVIHESRKRGKNGRTDKGARGIDLFFETHRCNALCRSLGLPPPVAGQPPGIPQR